MPAKKSFISATMLTSCKFDFDDYTDNKEDFEKKLEDFLAEHGPSTKQSLWKIDYLGVCTRYTDRIIEKCPRVMQYSADLEEVLNEVAAITTDRIWSPNGNDLIKDHKAFGTIAMIPYNDGTVWYSAKKTDEVFDRIEELENLDYCSCCTISNLYRIDYYISRGKIIAIAHIDTESG